MSYPASLIAYAFTKKGIEENKPVTQMKLQKMVYFAHGYHLAKFNEPLVDEIFEAWKYGPVVPAIYQTYKLYGSRDINDTFLVELFDGNMDLSKIDTKGWEAISYTWDVTKDLSALNLSIWSHKNGSPWAAAFTPDVNNIPIKNDVIKNFFISELSAVNGE